MPSINERIRDDLFVRERALWTAFTSADPAPAARKLCTPEANFLLPQTPIVALDGSDPSFEAVMQPPSRRFDYFALGDTRVIVLDLMAGVITYRITASRGGEVYNATGSSTWKQGSDGEWVLACHQETLL